MFIEEEQEEVAEGDQVDSSAFAAERRVGFYNNSLLKYQLANV